MEVTKDMQENGYYVASSRSGMRFIPPTIGAKKSMNTANLLLLNYEQPRPKKRIAKKIDTSKLKYAANLNNEELIDIPKMRVRRADTGTN